MRARARFSTYLGSAKDGEPSGMRMSQNIRAVPGASARHGRTWKVDGSGLAIMSDSYTRAKPSIAEPSKPIPSSKACSSSAGATATDLRKPSTSVNHRRTNRMSRSSKVRSTNSCCLSIFRFPILAGQAACLRVPQEAVGHLSITPQQHFVRVADLDRPGDPGVNASRAADVLLCRPSCLLGPSYVMPGPPRLTPRPGFLWAPCEKSPPPHYDQQTDRHHPTRPFPPEGHTSWVPPRRAPPRHARRA